MGVVLLIVLATVVSATNYYDEIHEGLGVQTPGDIPYESNTTNTTTNSTTNTTNYDYFVSVKDSIKIFNSLDNNNLGTVVNLSQDFGIADSVLMNSNGEVVEVKDPINWKPIIIWSLIIIILSALIFAGYYVYQIYF